MISSAVFTSAWQMLENRFGKQPPGSAKAYHTFLSQHMDDEGFSRAATAVWATREFFPRPADFFLVEREKMWQEAIRLQAMAAKNALDGQRAANWDKPLPVTWPDELRALPKLAQDVIWAIGGPVVMSESKLSTVQLRKEFFRIYEDTVCSMAVENPMALGSGTVKQIEGARKEVA